MVTEPAESTRLPTVVVLLLPPDVVPSPEIVAKEASVGCRQRLGRAATQRVMLPKMAELSVVVLTATRTPPRAR